MGLKNLQIFLLCHYAIAKLIIKKIWQNPQIGENISVLAQITIIALTVIMLICLIPILILFYCHKQMVKLILKYRYRSKFISLITGCDLLGALNETDGVAINTVLVVHSKKTGEDLFQEISRKIWNEFTDPQMDKKLISIRKSFMGYLYFKEIDYLNPRDILKRVRSDKSEIPQEELTEFLNYHCNVKPMPLNGAFNWDFTVVTTPLRKNNGGIRYLIIIRIHHFVVDGLTMYNLLKRIMKTEEDEVAYANNIAHKLNTQQKQRTISSNLKYLSTCSVAQPITDGSQLNFKPKAKGHLSIFTEPTQNCFLKLKEIKRKIPRASFNALILTAYSASLAEYFKDFTPKNCKIPTKLELLAPVQINMDRFSKYYGHKRKTKLGNDFTFFSLAVPIIPTDKENTPIEDYIVERLEMISRDFNEFNTNIDYMLNYTLTKTYLEVFPSIVANLFMKFASYNILMSVFPGGPKLQTFQGDDIEDLLVMVPLNSNKSDINFFSFSYDGKLQFIQIINENKFESTEKMDDVLKGILKYIDVLYEQTVKTSMD